MLKIPQAILDEMLAQAKAEAPVEACGYLAGKGYRVEKRFPLRNADNSTEHFSFDPKEQFKTVKEARSAGLELFAVYHSHPATPARPSEEDLKLAFDPEIVYVVITLLEQPLTRLAAFRVREQKVTAVPIEIIQEGRNATSKERLLASGGEKVSHPDRRLKGGEN